jgi:hypothetical protein
VHVSDEELAAAAAAGVNTDQDDFQLFLDLNRHFKSDLLSEAVDDFDERDAPQVVGVLIEEDF